MRRVNSTAKKTPGLHHLMSGIVHRSSRMVDTTNQRKLVCDSGVTRQNLCQHHIGRCGLDGLEGAAYFCRRIRLRVERVDLTWRT